ncbi:protoheme IX farnesyltransferase [Sulfodiicoccus acidiphilus]|uniref:Protoheme IX farnesyltransferase n=1 Tax=Sulfodiicoccus acidiphilus TaxID=1670455 RepID=A0A348B0L5_9CREN|nr:heme o synthase [Sulfodiicoccus acidiphilus]BBD71717.1 protoheme IX farnesyltransferase [Sulfodiicoccus acidiphilus]GGT86384.1 protoheme IX farnesyltransferase [Sulfodiicoccus acidiphilus]
MPAVRARLQSYAKLSKPRIVALLDLAAVAGALLAYERGLFNVVAFLSMLVGGSLASIGASMINESLEADRDKLMSRTSWRPTATGGVGTKEAALLGSSLVGVGTSLGLLANTLTAVFILLGALIYVVVYTILLKPRTYWNIVIGGFAGSAAAWAGYASLTGKFDLASFLLGFLIFMWTPGHFWSLALKYREDYARAGIPMLSVVTNERNTVLGIAISNFLMIPFALLLSIYLGLVYLIATALVSAALSYFTVRLVRNPTADEAWKSFKFSSPYLAIILMTIILVKTI